VSRAGRVQLGQKRELAAREALRYAATAARALEHVRDVSREFHLDRTLEAVRGVVSEAQKVERIARRQLEEADPGAPVLGLEP